MDELRLKRYKDKIRYIINNIKDLPFEPNNEFEKRGIFYSLQTSIESAIDLVAMSVKDLGNEVKEDALNIDKLGEIRKVEPNLIEKLKKANGLRNIIVHRYNDVDENIILNSVKEIKELIKRWLNIVEEMLDEISKHI
ncbi:MAG: DUF86 domain-containing protein [Promethearchaeota archaeon]